jgi:hypothetical protein
VIEADGVGVERQAEFLTVRFRSDEPSDPRSITVFSCMIEEIFLILEDRGSK